MRPPLVLPRALIFLASLWLVVSWILSMGGLRPPVHPSSTSYAHGLRLLLLCMATGLTIAWPLLRLSQAAVARPIAQTLLDAVVLAAMLQVILWPLRLVTAWTPMRTLAIDCNLLAFAAIAGALIAAVIGYRRTGPRILAMLACLSLGLAAPGVLLVTGPNDMMFERWSPYLLSRHLALGGGAPVPPAEWYWLAVVGAAAVMGWIAASICAPRPARGYVRGAAGPTSPGAP